MEMGWKNMKTGWRGPEREQETKEGVTCPYLRITFSFRMDPYSSLFNESGIGPITKY